MMQAKPEWSRWAVLAAVLAWCSGAQLSLAQFRVLVAFPDDSGELCDSLSLSGSFLYGSTSGGGTEDKGVVFKIKTDGTAGTVIHNFTGGANDGSTPWVPLTVSGNTVFGRTLYGGTNNSGVLYKMDTFGGGFTKLFDYGDLKHPSGSLTVSNSMIYAVIGGGGQDRGSVVKFTTDGTDYTVLHTFGVRGDIYTPCGSVTLSGSTLFGMTTHGGAGGAGGVYRLHTDGTGYAVLHRFNEVGDGRYAYGSLTVSGAALYGMTHNGGSHNRGVVFRMNTDGTGYVILHHFTFSVSDGVNPWGSLHGLFMIALGVEK
jgi:uncharacterized repeat protein (TIGR03803 family)